MTSQQYEPSFRWEDNTIYDHETAIARFTHDPDGKSHITLEDVVLAPGGNPLIRWTVSWHYGPHSTGKLESLNVEDGDATRLRLTFTASSLDGSYSTGTCIEVSFDPTRQCYRYDTSTELKVNRFPFYAWKEIDSSDWQSAFAVFPSEFANFLPLNSYNYWAPVLPMRKRWQDFVYQNTAGGWSNVPQHHLLTPDKYNIRFPAGPCKTGFVDDRDGNPCIELLDRLPATSQGAICWAMYDLHMHVDKCPLNQKHRVHYALYQFLPEETAAIQETATGYRYTEEEIALHDRPRFETDRTCDFETGVDFQSANDCFQFWLPMGEIKHTSWTHQEGRGGGRCLKNSAPEPARVLWQVESSNAPVVPAGKRYRVSAWVKTEALKGNAYLEAWDWTRENEPDPIRSDSIRNTTDWREVSVDVDVAPRKLLPGKIAIRLVHDGQGISWFDNVDLREAQ